MLYPVFYSCNYFKDSVSLNQFAKSMDRLSKASCVGLDTTRRKLLPVTEAMVRVLEAKGTKEIPVKIEEVYISLSEDKVEEKELTDSLSKRVFAYLTYPNNVTKDSRNIALRFINSGGSTATSIFSFRLSTIDKERKLLMVLSRENDPGSGTVCFYNFITPKKIDDVFKSQIKECIHALITTYSKELWVRSYLRENFRENRIRF